MVHISELVPGCDVNDLLVELHTTHSVDPGAKLSDPTYRATVRDATGYAALVYQASATCKPASIKKGRLYVVSGACLRPAVALLHSLPPTCRACLPAGRALSAAPPPPTMLAARRPAGQVVSQQGSLLIRVTSSWGKVEPAKGGDTLRPLPHSAAADLSAPARFYGALLLRQPQEQQLLAYVLPSLPPAAGGAKGAQGPPCAVPAVAAAGAENERAAAARWASHAAAPCPALRRLALRPAAGPTPCAPLGGARLLQCRRWLCCCSRRSSPPPAHGTAAPCAAPRCPAMVQQRCGSP
jgi:hypothetical protein